jgi:hypothetical protein
MVVKKGEREPDVFQVFRKTMINLSDVDEVAALDTGELLNLHLIVLAKQIIF